MYIYTYICIIYINKIKNHVFISHKQLLSLLKYITPVIKMLNSRMKKFVREHSYNLATFYRSNIDAY